MYQQKRLQTVMKCKHYALTSSSSLAQQPLLSQGLLQKLLPAVPIPCSIPPIFLPQLPGIFHHTIFPSSFRPVCLLPSTTPTRTLLVELSSAIRITCPARFNRLILMYVTISLSLYNVYNSLLYFILHSPLSFVGPKIALKIFLSKTPKIASSDFDNTHVSEPYASTGLIKVLYKFYFIFYG